MSDCECTCIVEGDWVESKLNTNVFGIVIGCSGAQIYVQLAGTLAVQAFHEATLRRIDGDDNYPGDGAKSDNVIDFTRAKDLRNAKAKGAA